MQNYPVCIELMPMKYAIFIDVEMPEHDLEPPRFSRRALERILNDWTAVKAMLLSGRRPRRNSSPDVIYEEQLYLESQSGTARLDKFTHCLLVKCSGEVNSLHFCIFLASLV